eukprot:59421-Rhodomonas_salina.1
MARVSCITFALCITSAAAFMTTPALRMPTTKAVSRGASASLTMQVNNPPSRRQLLFGLAGLAAGGMVGKPDEAAAAGEEIQVYFGSGCFWHVQHEFIEAEKKHLGRSEKESTSIAGYAGGLKTGPDGKVCYHNLMMDSDYGRMGHSEAVGVKV